MLFQLCAIPGAKRNRTTGDQYDARQQRKWKAFLVLDHAHSDIRSVLHGCNVMIDAVSLLWNRPLLDYTKAAVTWLRTRNWRNAVTGLVLAIIFGPLFVVGVYTVLISLMSL